MTSNAGTSLKSASIGFNSDKQQANKDSVNDALKKIFRPEFLNRVDDIVIFNSLEQESIRKITSLMLRDVISEAEEKGIKLSVSDEAIVYLAEKGFDEKYGARPLRRLIQKEIEDELAELFLRDEIKQGSVVNADIKNGGLKLELQ